MNAHYLKQVPEEWETKARIFAALGDGTRQKMLLLFEVDETIPLKTLVDVFPLSRSALVHHVTVLEQAGLLLARRQGREVGYTLNTALLLTSLEGLLDYAKNLGSISGGESEAVAGAEFDATLGAAPTTGPSVGLTDSIEASADARAKARDGAYSATKPQNTRSKTTALFVPLSAQELAHD